MQELEELQSKLADIQQTTNEYRIRNDRLLRHNPQDY